MSDAAEDPDAKPRWRPPDRETLESQWELQWEANESHLRRMKLMPDPNPQREAMLTERIEAEQDEIEWKLGFEDSKIPRRSLRATYQCSQCNQHTLQLVDFLLVCDGKGDELTYECRNCGWAYCTHRL